MQKAWVYCLLSPPLFRSRVPAGVLPPRVAGWLVVFRRKCWPMDEKSRIGQEELRACAERLSCRFTSCSLGSSRAELWFAGTYWSSVRALRPSAAPGAVAVTNLMVLIEPRLFAALSTEAISTSLDTACRTNLPTIRVLTILRASFEWLCSGTLL